MKTFKTFLAESTYRDVQGKCKLTSIGTETITLGDKQFPKYKQINFMNKNIGNTIAAHSYKDTKSGNKRYVDSRKNVIRYTATMTSDLVREVEEFAKLHNWNYDQKRYTVHTSIERNSAKEAAEDLALQYLRFVEAKNGQLTEEGNPNHASDGKFSSGGGSGAKSSDSSKSPKESEHKFKDSDSKKTISITGSDPETALKNHFSKEDSVDFVKVEKNGKNYTARVFYKTHGEPKDGSPISGPVDTYKFKLGK